MIWGVVNMKCGGIGVLENSELYFASPSQTAKNLYYCAISSGHFYCDKNYHLVRESFESILILHIINGTFTFVNREGRHITARAEDTVILDCYLPHEYYTADTLESVWVHVCGADALKFYNEITKASGNVIRCKDTDHINRLISRIIEEMSGNIPTSESAVSLSIYKLFLELLNPLSTGRGERENEERIESAKSFVFNNLDKKITVKSLSSIAQMSPSHFSRVFKSQTGFSPYDYVLTARLNRAKELLQKTDLTVAQIAESTGFNSEANFVYFFTGNTGISPGKFRKLKF